LTKSMTNPIEDFRNDHSDFTRNTNALTFDNPWDGFHAWFNEAVNHGELEANAMVIATVNPEGMPSTRVVYLKEIFEESFVFYTNYLSEKGRDLDMNPKASLLFFWPGLERQIRIQGTVVKIDAAISDAYFASRPRESQLGAWASFQSEQLNSMEDMTARFQEFSEKYPNEVPRPAHWGGMALVPSKFEFWQGKPSRLHERLVFEGSSNTWDKFRLNP
ncbi:MAG: pyridoxamine 5'-phosphate oxidase, partial [Bacteroidota bacterium]